MRDLIGLSFPRFTLSEAEERAKVKEWWGCSCKYYFQQSFDILNKKETIMPVSLNLGKIDIYDAEVASFIENKSVDEIKSLLVDLLKNRVSAKQPSDNDLDNRLRSLKVINHQRGKRVREALESLNIKLKPIKNINIDEAKENSFKEKFAL